MAPWVKLYPSQYLQYPGDFPYRDAHPIMQGVGCGHGPAPHPVRCGPNLVWRQIGMLTSYLMSTPGAVADPYPVLGDFGSWHGRNVGDVGEVYSVLFQAAPTLRASFQGDWYIYRRFRDLLRSRGLTEGEGAGTRLAPGTLGLARPGTFGERRGLAFGAPLEGGDFGLQPFDSRGRISQLPLQLQHQDHQVFPA